MRGVGFSDLGVIFKQSVMRNAVHGVIEEMYKTN